MFRSYSKWNKGKKANWASIPEDRPVFSAKSSLWIVQIENGIRAGLSLWLFEASRSMLKDSPLRRADTHQTMWRKKKITHDSVLWLCWTLGVSNVFWSSLGNSPTATPPALDFNAPATLVWTPSAGSEGRGGTTDVAWTPRPQPLTPGAARRCARKNVGSKGECLQADEIKPQTFFFFFHYHSLQRREERRRRRYSEKPWLRPFISIPQSLQQTEGRIFHKSGDWNRQIIRESECNGYGFFYLFI